MDLEPITRLTRDLKWASVTLSDDEARFLVDTYYTMQENRIRADGQIRSITQSDTAEPHSVLDWYSHQAGTMEKQVARALDAYSAGNPLGQWARRNVGVGPVIAAGLLANIRFERGGQRIQTASALWKYAGMDPTSKWEKGQKRPWNAKLKVICAFKLGESFVKTASRDNAFYGPLYQQRKAIETERNANGEFADQAERILQERKIGKTTDAYKAYSTGRLPKAHIHRRAVRWAVKMFLSHYHQVGYFMEFGEKPPKPYVFSVQGHADIIHPPFWEEIIAGKID